jgi:hypothetical protein
VSDTALYSALAAAYVVLLVLVVIGGLLLGRRTSKRIWKELDDLQRVQGRGPRPVPQPRHWNDYVVRLSAPNGTVTFEMPLNRFVGDIPRDYLQRGYTWQVLKRVPPKGTDEEETS